MRRSGPRKSPTRSTSRLSFRERDLLQLSADLSLDDHSREWRYGSQSGNSNQNILPSHGGHGNGDRTVLLFALGAEPRQQRRLPVRSARHPKDKKHSGNENH
jgi:hypothetical protein